MNVVRIVSKIKLVECIIDGVVRYTLEIVQIVSGKLPVKFGGLEKISIKVWIDSFAQRAVAVMTKALDLVSSVVVPATKFVMHLSVTNHEGKHKFEMNIVVFSTISEILPPKATRFCYLPELRKGSIKSTVEILHFVNGLSFCRM